jgi:hypothetical protein
MEIEYTSKIQRGEIKLPGNADMRFAGHSEIVALDQAIKARRAAGIPIDEKLISELYLQNIDMIMAFRTGDFLPVKRCANCRFLTEGIKLVNGTT